MATQQTDVAYLRAAKDLYYLNSGYDANESLDEAKLFVQACRQLIGIIPRRAQLGNSTPALAEFDLATLQKELTVATRWMRGKIRAASSRTGWRQFQLYPNRDVRAGID